MKNKVNRIQISNRFNHASNSARLWIAAVLLSVCVSMLPFSVASAAAERAGGASGQMPAFYEGEEVTVNMMELPNSEVLIEENANVNEIYAYADLDEEQEFAPIIDAIQGEDFTPLWRQILIVFNEGFTPHQFVSEAEVDEAASGDNPEITLVETDEVYLCAVLGRKPIE